MKNKYLLILCLVCAFTLPSIHASGAPAAAEPEHIAQLRTIVYDPIEMSHPPQLPLLDQHISKFGAESFTPEFVYGMIEITKGITHLVQRMECFWTFREYSKNEYFPEFKTTFQALYQQFKIDEVDDSEHKSQLIVSLCSSLSFVEPADYAEIISRTNDQLASRKEEGLHIGFSVGASEGVSMLQALAAQKMQEKASIA